MKKIFLIIMLFLLPLQYTWAMVASYDMHDAKDTKVHFGHHEHPSTESHTETINLSADDDTKEQVAKCHVHCGFSHLSCGAVLNHNLPSFVCESNRYTSQYLFNYHSPPANTLERPNWRIAV